MLPPYGGDAEAQFKLGVCYHDASDFCHAVKWYRAAAEQGHAKAQYDLGLCYDQGWGVEMNATEAARWYRASAEQGDDDAQYNLGVCYFLGSGVGKNMAEALKWWHKAAQQGNRDAQDALHQPIKVMRDFPRRYSLWPFFLL